MLADNHTILVEAFRKPLALLRRGRNRRGRPIRCWKSLRGLELLTDAEGVNFDEYLRGVYLSVKKRCGL